MKTGTGSSLTESTLLDRCLYPLRKISEGFWYVMGDAGKIIRPSEREQFLFGELADRALDSKEGYAETYIGLPFLPASLRASSFFVFTGDKYIKAAAEYGEYVEGNPAHFDPQARAFFEPMKEYLGMTSIINMNGPEVKKERSGIMKSLSIARAVEAAWRASDKQKQNWSDENSLNNMLCFITTQVIADAWFNIKEIREELIPLLKKAEYYVFNRDKVSNADFEKLCTQIKTLNDEVLTKQEAEITCGPSYLTYLKEDRKKPSLKDLNALAALVVEGNITTVLTGAVLQLANNKKLQDQLRAELNSIKDIDLHSNEGYAEIKRLPLLNQIYLESLRYYSPAPPIVRQASQAGEINGVYIPPRSILFILLRRVMHDPKLWTHPELFDPSRFAAGDQSLNQYPLTPFSSGSRKCPASYGFAEAMFKITLVNLFKDHELKLNPNPKLPEGVETIPVVTKEPRFKETYFGEYRKITPEVSVSDENSPMLRFSPGSMDAEKRLRKTVETPLPHINGEKKTPTMTTRKLNASQ